MRNVKLWFALIEFLVVIHSSYFLRFSIPQQYTLNRFKPTSTVLRQCEVPTLKNGTVRLRQRGKLIRYTCSSSFVLIGDRYSSCVQGHWENPVPMCIKPGCLAITAPDNGFTVVDKNGAMTMLFCKPGYSIAGSQETYCDGTAWDRSLGSCRQTQTSPEMSCDFEVSSICDWVPDSSHDFEWKRKNGYTSVKQLQTGPSHDHTVGIPLEGHFMLATFANQLPNSAARLISPLYPANASQNACFRLYYHMYGATTGVLRVYVKPESVAIGDILDVPKYLFMEKVGTFQNAWIESVFDVDQYDEGFQIVIEATAVRTTRSNIAIDDVALLSDADCTNEEAKSTIVTPEEGGIFDAQSCQNRCQETGPYSTNATEEIRTNTNESLTLLHCDCFDGCEDLKSCCLDYRSVCVFDVSTIESSDAEPNTVSEIMSLIPNNVTIPSIPSTTERLPTTKTVTTTVTPSTSIKTSVRTSPVTTPSTTISTTVKTTSRTTLKPTYFTVTLGKRTTSIATTRPTTRSTTTTSKVTVVPTTMLKTVPTTMLKTVPTTMVKTVPTTMLKTVPTKAIKTLLPTSPSVATTSTIAVPLKVVTKVTKLNAYHDLVTKSEPEDVNHNNKWHSIVDSTDTDPLPRNLLYVLGVALIIGATGLISFNLFKKYRNDPSNYKKKSKRYSEDASDEVRFLTADEQLNFTMQTEGLIDR